MMPVRIRWVLAVALALVPQFAAAQSAVPMPAAKIQLFDNSGAVLNGGLLYSYLPGTTTPLETCADNNLSAGACVTPNTNPVILGSDGRASVFLRPQVYKFILKTSAGVTLWTADQITSTTYLGSGTASTGTFLRGDYSWARARTVITATDVGTQNNYNPGSGIIGDTLILANNASALTITGFSPAIAPWDGQKIWVISKGAGQVNLTPQSASSTAAYRLINYATVADTPLGAGGGTVSYVYDASTARWRIDSHDQGPWIAYTPVWGNTGTANTQGNATMSGRYRLSGRLMTFTLAFAFGSTSASGNLVFTFTLPAAANAAGQAAGTATITDASAGGAYTGVVILTTTTVFSIYNTNAISTGIGNTVPMAWATSDSIQVAGTYEVP